MRFVAALWLLSLASMWAVAAWLYPDLPERIPMHFGSDGTPDRYVERTVWNWCLLPGIGTLLAGLLGAVLPAWFRRMSDAGSKWLNMPDQRSFLALPADARRRALQPLVAVLRLIAVLLAALFSFVLFATAKVASGAWPTLPSLPTWLLLAGMMALSVLSIPLGVHAVARERRALTGGAASPR